MLSTAEREERARSIRRHLLDYMNRPLAPSLRAAALIRARDELDILCSLELPQEEKEGGMTRTQEQENVLDIADS